jgi:GNAT superfamily N-acetyltransferase
MWLSSRMHVARKAAEPDVGPMAGALARSFEDDPVMAWLFPDGGTRVQKLERWFRHEGLRHLAHDTVYTADGHPGAAYWDPPGHWKMPLTAILRSAPLMVRLFGSRIPTALSGLGKVEKVHPTEPHYYLAVLGTEPEQQGKGVGSALLAPVLSHCDTEGIPAYLESSKERNIPFYSRHGFEVTGEVELPKGPKVWTMWREPRS